MNTKDHKIILAILFFSSFNAISAEVETVWSNSRIGECFTASAEKNTSNKIRQNEIAVQKFGKDTDWPKYFMFWDTTPNNNPIRILHRRAKDQKECVIGYFPFAEDHNFKILAAGKIPEKITTSTGAIVNADGKSESVILEYLLDKNTGFYSKTPAQCFKSTENLKKAIDCSEAFN